MVTDHSQARRWCLDIYLETAFAQKVCYFCIHSFGMILRCLVGIIKAGDNPTPSFPQALHDSSYAFHPQSPPPLPTWHTNPRAATSGFTLQNSKGRHSLALNEWCSWCRSVHNLYSCTKQSYPGCLHSSHLLPKATLRPVLDLTPDSTPGLCLKS